MALAAKPKQQVRKGKSMSMLKEFKEFALRGNVVDLAVGVIIGAAFGKIVSSLVEDVIMPPIGLVMGGEDFSNLFIRLNSKTAEAHSLLEAKKLGPVIAYGRVFDRGPALSDHRVLHFPDD